MGADRRPAGVERRDVPRPARILGRVRRTARVERSAGYDVRRDDGRRALVRGWPPQRDGNLPRSQRRDATRGGCVSLSARGRIRARRHLRRALRGNVSPRKRAPGGRREARRPRVHLPAALDRGHRRDARVRANRRGAQRRVRRARRDGAPGPHRRRGRGGRDRCGHHVPARQRGRLAHDPRRRGGERADRAPHDPVAACDEATAARCRDARLGCVHRGAGGNVRTGDPRCERRAVHLVHERHDRQTERRRDDARRLLGRGGRDAAGHDRSRARGYVLVYERHRVDRRPLADRVRRTRERPDVDLTRRLARLSDGRHGL